MSFTQLPDSLIDSYQLNPYELACAVFISRKTMGWGKRTDGIAYSQFVDALSMSRNTVIKSVKKLVNLGIIDVVKTVKNNGSAGYNFYSFSDDFINKSNAPHLGGSAGDALGGSAGDALGVVQEMHPQDKPINKIKSSCPNKVGTQEGAQADADGFAPDTEVADSSVKTKSPKKKACDDGENIRLAKMMYGRLDLIRPGMKQPNLKSWAEVFRKMRALDGRTPEEIREVFVWANGDEFWQSNILSPDKLRKQFDQLAIKMKNGRRIENGAGQRTRLSDGERNELAAERYFQQHGY